MSKAAYLFPGQGAQSVGMGKDFYDAFSAAREVYEEAEEVLRAPLTQLIFSGSPEELSLTKNAQVAIYVTSFAIFRVFQSQFRVEGGVFAGLSLGEYSALAASGRLSFVEGLRLVQARGLAMQRACEEAPGSMRVVLGLSEEEVAKGVVEGVWIANLNCPGQVVIAGRVEALGEVEARLKERGAKRVLPLEVSGAFHTPLMRSAREALEPLILGAKLGGAANEFVMNVPGDFVEEESEVRKNLVLQVTSPTRWEQGIRKMRERGVEKWVEFGPGKTLSGMNRKIGLSETVSIEKVEDLEAYAAR